MKLVLLIALGASIGAVCRWLLSLWLNPLGEQFAVGTLLANLIGCFIIGIMMAVFFTHPNISAQWRVFIVTGFLGSLTTFSSFSGEVLEKLLSEKWLNAFGVMAIHLGLGLACTALGYGLWRWWH
ncbi:fluoride efflux transporter CrcB [Spirabiliibacterium falconis]|uniref:fluoride efflux transporter CrcB n=1 Tax=Spirabiliibacterium falconis TaxID=572023 RepID=UPI001AAC9876|nr:fluoride efflux transporter CrcB [Spirabiliibacterium falconis]MBE2895121.1 fluoride efflux transporter CrcB [Spirabiliibacterium falconis]